MTGRFEFTAQSVKNFAERPAPGKRLYVYCDTEKGLAMAVSPTGRKSFFYHGRVRGKPERIPLGKFPETSVKDAKSRCVLVRAAIEQGRDPRLALTVTRRRRGAITLEEFFAVWVADHASRKRKDVHLVERDFELYCADLAGQPLESITPDQLRRWHARLGKEKGERTANKAAGMLSAIFSKGMTWERPDGGRYCESNPASAKLVERFREQERDRFMSLDECRLFWSTVSSFEPAAGRHFFTLAICTGQRKANLMSMKYENIDMTNWIWTVPNLKGGKRNHPVPLVGLARYVIEVRREFSRSEWVFPGRRRNGRHIANVTFWWDAICREAGFDDLTIHDLRRTLASYMAMTGASYAVIAQLLAHTIPGPTQIYARLDVEPVRTAIERALEEMGIGYEQQR